MNMFANESRTKYPNGRPGGVRAHLEGYWAKGKKLWPELHWHCTVVDLETGTKGRETGKFLSRTGAIKSAVDNLMIQLKAKGIVA